MNAKALSSRLAKLESTTGNDRFLWVDAGEAEAVAWARQHPGEPMPRGLVAVCWSDVIAGRQSAPVGALEAGLDALDG